MKPGMIPTRPATERDEEIVDRILRGEHALYETLMRRYNQRLFRVVRAVLRNDTEAEDVVQETYVRAWHHLDQFAGRALFSTWLTKIAVNEASLRVQKRRLFADAGANARDGEAGEKTMDRFTTSLPNPEQQAIEGESRALLEAAIDALPDQYRCVYMMREVEEMSTAETAECLGIGEENVKVRLHRGRQMLRRDLYARLGSGTAKAFAFDGERCDRMVRRVLGRLEDTGYAAGWRSAGN
jgi:RNA polymerase sigma-70 factor, ECF subfamily